MSINLHRKALFLHFHFTFVLWVYLILPFAFTFGVNFILIEEDGEVTEKETNKWGSYLHRWSGGIV